MKKHLILALSLSLCFGVAAPAFAKGGKASASHSKGAAASKSSSSSKSTSKSSGTTNPSSHSVNGYTTKKGTVVAPHRQTDPNSTKKDNWSTKGNVNPITGKAGTKSPN